MRNVGSGKKDSEKKLRSGGRRVGSLNSVWKVRSV